MKTDDLIQKLSKNVAPVKGADSLLKFSLKGTIVLALIFPVSFIILPIRQDFGAQLQNTGFAVENLLWISTGILAAVSAYRHSIPGLSTVTSNLFTLISFVALMLTIPWGSTYTSHSMEEELQLYRGMCGGLISMFSAFTAVFFFMWAKKNAPTNYKLTGFWIVLSTSCFGSMAMQLVCAHDSAFHLYLWHVLPTTALAVFGTYLGSKLLRW